MRVAMVALLVVLTGCASPESTRSSYTFDWEAAPHLPPRGSPQQYSLEALMNYHSVFDWESNPGMTRVNSTIYFNGEIEGYHAVLFNERVKKHRVDRVVIRSGGGYLYPAIEMAYTVLKHRMDVHVHEKCSSACVCILAAGRKRTASKDAVIGLHKTTHGLLDGACGEIIAARMSPTVLEVANATNNDEIAYFTGSTLRGLGITTE